MKLIVPFVATVAGLGFAIPPEASEAATRVRLGVSVGVSHPTAVHHRTHHVHRFRRYPSSHRIGYERGYDDGLRQGERDFRKHRRYDPWRHKRYRKADKGYKRRYGSRFVYSQGYRSGYRDGYRLGYDGRYGHRYGYERHDRRDRYYRDGRRGRILYEEPPHWRWRRHRH